MIDLHTHSTFSDGSDTPEQLAENASKIGISAISLTDHDTTASHERMAASCAQFGIELIPGTEVSLRDGEFPKQRSGGPSSPRNIHVLAYFLPLNEDHPVQQKLAEMRRDRNERNETLVRLLRENGFEKINLDYLTNLVGNADNIGRPHFAQAMFELHPEIVGVKDPENWNKVFIDWLGESGKAHVGRKSMSVESFLDAAKGSGTVFSVAHPLVNYVSSLSPTEIEDTMPKVLNSLRDRGFAGAEAYYGGVNEKIRGQVVKLTRNAGMIPTGGSDYHGSYKEDVKLGLGRTGDLRVPNEVLDELKAAR